MTKLLWVSLPLLLAAGALAWLSWRDRLPSRQALNVVFSLLLMAYVLVTAGLGIFWVANQHLPVFDWHYLSGYTMLAVLVVHLAFNLRVVWAFLRRLGARRSSVATAVGGLERAGRAAAGAQFVQRRPHRGRWSNNFTRSRRTRAWVSCAVPPVPTGATGRRRSSPRRAASGWRCRHRVALPASGRTPRCWPICCGTPPA